MLLLVLSCTGRGHILEVGHVPDRLVGNGVPHGTSVTSRCIVCTTC